MSSAGSGSGTATGNNNDVDEADNGVVNEKYPLWAHASKVASDATGSGVEATHGFFAISVIKITQTAIQDSGHIYFRLKRLVLVPVISFQIMSLCNFTVMFHLVSMLQANIFTVMFLSNYNTCI